MLLCLQVEQRYALVPLEDEFATVYAALRAHIAATPGYKVIAFFTTARWGAGAAMCSSERGNGAGRLLGLLLTEEPCGVVWQWARALFAAP